MTACLALTVFWVCLLCGLRVSLSYGRGDRQPACCGALMQVAGWTA